MGLFLETGILKSCSRQKAEELLRTWAATRQSAIIPSDCQMEEQNGGVVMVLNDGSLFEGNEAFFKFVSAEIAGPVLSLYIYDGDYWGYSLFSSGREIDEFSPMPNYFEEADEAALQKVKGNSRIVADCFDVPEDRIRNYLVTWTEEMLEGEGKAYEEDEYGYQDWQLCDFMKKLGYTYFIV
jgi:hypothetical protein